MGAEDRDLIGWYDEHDVLPWQKMGEHDNGGWSLMWR